MRGELFQAAHVLNQELCAEQSNITNLIVVPLRDRIISVVEVDSRSKCATSGALRFSQRAKKKLFVLIGLAALQRPGDKP